jgi:hypothetical protein
MAILLQCKSPIVAHSGDDDHRSRRPVTGE